MATSAPPHDVLTSTRQQRRLVRPLPRHTYIPGSTSGLVLAHSTFLQLGQIEPGAGGAHFAAALAAGDVNGDEYDELAVSSPWYGGRPGRVDVLPGSPDGPNVTGVQTLTPDQLDEPALDPGWETYGLTLQLAQLDTQPGADLLVGMGLAYLKVDGTKIQSAGAVAQIPSRGGVWTRPHTGSSTRAPPVLPERRPSGRSSARRCRVRDCTTTERAGPLDAVRPKSIRTSAVWSVPSG